MSVIFLILSASLLIAIGFLIAFIWSVKSDQYEDDYTPSVRMLFENDVKQSVEPTNKEKHFLVIKLVPPLILDAPITMVELESVFSKRSFTIAWRDLTDAQHWKQGWI